MITAFIHDPESEGEWRPGAAADWWLHHSLQRLSESISALGGRLILRQGDSLQCLLDLARETGATRIVWNRLYEPAIVGRDTAIKTALRGTGLQCDSFNAALFFEPWEVRTGQGGPYRVFTPFWRACEQRLDELPSPLVAPRQLAGVSPSISSASVTDLHLLPSIRWDAGISGHWTPGESAAHARLAAFCDSALARYDDGRNRPDLDGCSRLSPFLHFGEVSPRQCLTAVRNSRMDHPASGKAAAAFIRELGWREFAHHLLHHFPQTTNQPLDPRFEQYPWEPDSQLLLAWQQGRTGYPIVDAGMRELWNTGWMHNRVRMIAASLLTKNLRQHWLDGARWFWDTLVDADLANNTSGWQWTAGCGADAAPYFRIFNPVLQAERFDPAHAYIRRWVPELAPLPDAWIHRPWQAPAGILQSAGIELGRQYPKPIVDFPLSRDRALAGYAVVKGAAHIPP